MTTVILCGGSGTRLWPLSRQKMPKQFTEIFPGETLFESTVKRNTSFNSKFIIAANAFQSKLAETQLTNVGVDNYKLLIEPIGRNTAPAIALSCMLLDRDEIVLVVPSDHLITGSLYYRQAMEKAIKLAELNKIVTFGIQPAYAETGYGYIEVDGDNVLSFKEKPSKDIAQAYVDSGKFLWNSGMFCFKAGVFLDEMKEHASSCYEACVKCFKQTEHKNVLSPSKENMMAIPSISVDYAVMEKSKKIACVSCPTEMGWGDLGSFDALYDELSKAESIDGNATAGSHRASFVDSKNNLVVSQGKRIVMVGVQDLIVVDTKDALLIAPRGESQKVKDAVEEVKKSDPELL